MPLLIEMTAGTDLKIAYKVSNTLRFILLEAPLIYTYFIKIFESLNF